MSLKQLLLAEDLSQQPCYTVPSCPLHHGLGCLNRVKAREDAARQLTLPNERQAGPHSGVSTK